MNTYRALKLVLYESSKNILISLIVLCKPSFIT